MKTSWETRNCYHLEKRFSIRMKEIKINNILEDAFSVDASRAGFGSIFLLHD